MERWGENWKMSGGLLMRPLSYELNQSDRELCLWLRYGGWTWIGLKESLFLKAIKLFSLAFGYSNRLLGLIPFFINFFLESRYGIGEFLEQYWNTFEFSNILLERYIFFIKFLHKANIFSVVCMWWRIMSYIWSVWSIFYFASLWSEICYKICT